MRTRTVALLWLAVTAGLAAPGALAASQPATATAAGTATDDQSRPDVRPNRSVDSPRLVGAYPNPVARDDAGEFVVLEVPPGTNLSSHRLADDGRNVALPNVTTSGRVVLSNDANRSRRLLGDETRVVAADPPPLANGGERVRLLRNGTVVDSFTYRDAPEGERYVREEGSTWRPLGATDRRVTTSGPTTATAFVLPDSPEVAVDALSDAEERVLLAGYTFTSPRITEELLAAHRRGVRVEVLVEGGPVGGLTTPQARALDRLVRAGVPVRAMGGPRARYAYHHAKYAVVDDRALVLTENWKPSGVGGRASRGWGTLVDDATTANALAETFRADAGWLDARPWRTWRANASVHEETPAAGDYPRHVAPERVPVERVRTLVAPDNAEPALRGVVGNASESLDVVQVSLGGPDGPFTSAAVDAARRGVRVRILLSGAWYVRDENAALARQLNAVAEAEDLPLSVRLADPGGRFEKVHAKGVVVDDSVAVVGSLNWNAHAARENREVALVLEGESVGGYYADAFEADWTTSGDGASREFPVGVALGGLVAVVGALVLARRVEFDPE
ncbi:phospholipase D-like domain-containing protein [Halomarina ordinaria]|uniref:Phospholipase D-like domain-containing protein n=1 Tax=Halomarina ordinaria TaxID=3033939 RepID=A0ABD5UBZ4_9EURY|nr:phospholipase D-like domain-containing protein [Halomarina sp. PSRA2]